MYLNSDTVFELHVVGDIEELIVDSPIVGLIIDDSQHIDVAVWGRSLTSDRAKEHECINAGSEAVANVLEESRHGFTMGLSGRLC